MSAASLAEALSRSIPEHRVMTLGSQARRGSYGPTGGDGGEPATPRERIKLIVDSDAGTDDATSLMAAFRDPLVDVVAVTVVDGNTTLAQGIKNMKTIISVAGRKDIPIYAGASGPLVRGFNKKELWPGNGIDGLGNVTVQPPEELALPGTDDIHVPRDVHAASKLVELVNANPHTYEILAIGPLTNIALAISLDPTFIDKVRGIYIMGGTLYAKGNANRSAEFNIHCDPEAAHIVFHASTICTQGAAQRYAAALDAERSASSIASLDSTAPPKMILPPDFVPKLCLATWEMTVEHGFPWSFFDYLTQTEPVNKFGKFLGTFHKCAESLSRAQYEILAMGPRPMSPVQPVLISRQPTTDVTKTESTESTHSTTDSGKEGDSEVRKGNGKEQSTVLHAPSATKPNRNRNGSTKKHTHNKSQHEEYLCGTHSFLMPDFYALIAMIDPNSIIAYKDWDVQVELHGQFTRGMTHFDWFGSSKTPNCRVILEMDRDIVREFYERTFKHPF